MVIYTGLVLYGNETDGTGLKSSFVKINVVTRR